MRLNPKRQLAAAFFLSLLINGLLLGGLYHVTWAAVGVITRHAAPPRLVMLHYQAQEEATAVPHQASVLPPISEPVLPAPTAVPRQQAVMAPRQQAVAAPATTVAPPGKLHQQPVFLPPTPPEPEQPLIAALPSRDAGGHGSAVPQSQPISTGGGKPGDAAGENGSSPSAGHSSGASGATGGPIQVVTVPSPPPGGSGDAPVKAGGGNSAGSKPVAGPAPERPATAPLAPTTPPKSEPPSAATAPAGLQRAARVVKKTQPSYPEDARRAGSEGTVVLRVHLDAQARVTDIEVIESAGDRRLDRAAEREVKKKWVFEPALEDGKPIASTLRVRMPFRLE